MNAETKLTFAVVIFMNMILLCFIYFNLSNKLDKIINRLKEDSE